MWECKHSEETAPAPVTPGAPLLSSSACPGSLGHSRDQRCARGCQGLPGGAGAARGWQGVAGGGSGHCSVPAGSGCSPGHSPSARGMLWVCVGPQPSPWGLTGSLTQAAPVTRVTLGTVVTFHTVQPSHHQLGTISKPSAISAVLQELQNLQNSPLEQTHSQQRGQSWSLAPASPSGRPRWGHEPWQGTVPAV